MYLTFAVIPNMIEDVDQSRIIYLRALESLIFQSLRKVKFKYRDYVGALNIHHLYYIVKITEVQVLLFL